MKLFQRIFFAAVLAGLAAGLVMSAVQQWKVAPLILAAEVFETAPHDHDHAAATTDVGAVAESVAPAAEEPEAWAPQDGPERIFYTVLSDLLASIGFALVLAAVAVVSGLPITARNGVIWGLCGFIAFHLAPAFGLAPELPGMPAADLGARQIWWWATVLATSAAFFAIAKYRNWTAIGIAAVLLVLPHIIGAPQLAGDHESGVPAHLATEFAANSLATAALFWMIAGPLYGYLYERFAAVTVAREAHA